MLRASLFFMLENIVPGADSYHHHDCIYVKNY